MENVIKIGLITFILLYFISPVDLAPGPIDDAIVGLLGLLAARKLPLRVED